MCIFTFAYLEPFLSGQPFPVFCDASTAVSQWGPTSLEEEWMSCLHWSEYLIIPEHKVLVPDTQVMPTGPNLLLSWVITMHASCQTEVSLCDRRVQEGKDYVILGLLVAISMLFGVCWRTDSPEESKVKRWKEILKESF